MRKIKLKQVDVFTTKPFGGNPALVTTQADGLTMENMLNITREMNISESTFVTMPQSNDALFRIRFFTQNGEYNLSGHAMIATCFALAEEGRIPLQDGLTTIYMETNAGNLPVDFHLDKSETGPDSGIRNSRVPLEVDGISIGMLERIMIHCSIREYKHPDVPVTDIAETLGIDKNEIIRTGLPVEIVFNGVYQLVVPVLHKYTLLKMQPDLIKLKLLNQKLGVQTSDIFTLDSIHDSCVTYSRHFTPAMGMWEDLGSGAGAASISAYLLKHGTITPRSMIMEQGKDIDRLCQVQVTVDYLDDNTASVQVGGLAVTSLTRNIVVEGEKITQV